MVEVIYLHTYVRVYIKNKSNKKKDKQRNIICIFKVLSHNLFIFGKTYYRIASFFFFSDKKSMFKGGRKIKC